MAKRRFGITLAILSGALLLSVAAFLLFGGFVPERRTAALQADVNLCDSDYLWSSQILKDMGNKDSVFLTMENYLGTPEQRQELIGHVVRVKAGWRNGGVITVRTPKAYVAQVLGYSSYDEAMQNGYDAWSDHFSYLWDGYEEALGRNFIEYRRGAGDRLVDSVAGNGFASIEFMEGGKDCDYNEVRIPLQGLLGVNTTIEQEIAVREYLEKEYAPGGSMYKYRAENDLVTDFEKYKAVYNFTKRFNYVGRTNESLYDAFFGKGMACDGFSTLTVILCQYCGLDSVSVIGSLNGVAHAWNWVKIGDHYYNTENTASKDDNKGEDGWILDGMEELDGSRNKFFLSYTDGEPYVTPQAKKKYPRARLDWRDSEKIGDYIDAGHINQPDGGKLRWVLESGVLTVTGKGEMRDFGNQNDVPWISCADYIREIRISEDITNIGANAFSACPKVTYESVKNGLPEGIKIGENAFSDLEDTDGQKTAYIRLNDGAGVRYTGSALGADELVAMATYGDTAAASSDVSFRHRAVGAETWAEGGPVNAGTWEVEGTIAAKTVGGTHYAESSATCVIMLLPAKVYIIGLRLAGATKVYDGTDDCRIDGVVLNDKQIPLRAQSPVFGVDYTLRGRYSDPNVKYDTNGKPGLKDVYAADIVMLDTQLGKNYVIVTSGAPYEKAKITPAALTSDLFDEIPDQQYTGKAVQPEVMISEHAASLIGRGDFTVSYRNNTSCGTAYADIAAAPRCNYAGSVTLEFKISEQAPAAVDPILVLNQIDRPYNGLALSVGELIGEARYGQLQASEEDISFRYRPQGGEYAEGLPKDAGSYDVEVTLRARAAGGVRYSAARETVSAVIAKAPLKVVANSVSVSYGRDAPYSQFTVSYEGLVNGETGFEAINIGSWRFDYAYAAGSPVGEYKVKPVGGASSNYELEIVLGNMTVTPSEVILDWQNVTGRYFGDGLAVTAKAGGVYKGDAIGVTVKGGDMTSVGTHTATAVALTGEKAYCYKLPKSASVQYTIERGESGGIAANIAEGYTYGEKMNILVDLGVSVGGEVALYIRTAYGDLRISKNAIVTGGTATLAYDTTEKLLSVGEHTLVVKYGGSGELPACEAEYSVTLKALTLTPVWDGGSPTVQGVLQGDENALVLGYESGTGGVEKLCLTDKDGVTAGFYKLGAHSLGRAEA